MSVYVCNATRDRKRGNELDKQWLARDTRNALQTIEVLRKHLHELERDKTFLAQWYTAAIYDLKRALDEIESS